MWPWIFLTIAATVVFVVIHDLIQKKHAILKNFPLIGHFRYWLEAVGPELRQYIVTSNNEERPFSRDHRSWIYASSKRQNNYSGFGSDNEMELESNYMIIKPSAFPLQSPHPGDDDYDPEYRIPCAKILGGYRSRKKAFRPHSVVNFSAMSFGSLSGPAIEALNRGAKIADCLHNTGEGSVSPHHLHGGELIFQLGTAYFGCRDEKGNFDLSRLTDLVERHPQIRAIEIKLSQGAKPGLGGILPAKKITAEISRIRGIPMGKDCISPAKHKEFHDVDSMLDFVELLAEKTGLPVGIKSAIGESEFWEELATLMASDSRAVDFITVDGGEGGTGAGPLVFSDQVAFPFKIALSRVFRAFAERSIQENVVFLGSAKLGFPESALLAFSMGCDMISVAREAMLALGCIQAQKCHTDHCPTGIATQNRWFVRGLDPTLKSQRVANYIFMLRKEILALSCAAGVPHPALISADQIEILNGRYEGQTVSQLFHYKQGFSLPSVKDQTEICEIMNNGNSRSS